MLLVIFLQLVVIVGIVRASRQGLENALPIFCFFLVLLPLESKLVIPGLFDINTMRVSLVTLTILYFYRRERIDEGSLPLKGIIMVHIGWAIASTLYSLSISTSVKQLLSQILEYYVLYFVMVKTISKTETLHKMIFSMMMAMGVCCLIAVVEVWAHWSILRIFPSQFWITYNGGFDPLYTELGRGLRVRSTFPHPILFGDALAMSIPFNLYLLDIWENKSQSLLLWINLILMIWAIYKTSSRGPWIATVLSCILLFIFMKNRVRKYLMTIAALALAVLLVRPGIWSTVEALYQSTTDPSTPVGTSYLYRDALNEAVKKSVNKEPGRALLGYGLGTFRVLGLDIDFLGSVRHWYTCDNNWASFLYETGYVGLLIMMILLFRALLFILKNYRRLPYPDNELSGVIFISLTGFYFLLLSVAGYSWGQQGYMAWVMISMGVSQSRIAARNDQEAEMDDERLEIEESYDLYVT
jgi:O-antigen ligase